MHVLLDQLVDTHLLDMQVAGRGYDKRTSYLGVSLDGSTRYRARISKQVLRPC